MRYYALGYDTFSKKMYFKLIAKHLVSDKRTHIARSTLERSEQALRRKK